MASPRVAIRLNTDQICGRGIYSVRPGLLNINWASHTPDFSVAKTSILVFRGLVISSGALVTPDTNALRPLPHQTVLTFTLGQ